VEEKNKCKKGQTEQSSGGEKKQQVPVNKKANTHIARRDGREDGENVTIEGRTRKVYLTSIEVAAEE